MTYHLLHRGALCAALLLAAVPTLAQPTQDGPAGLGLRPTLGDEVPARQDPPPIGGPLACGAQAALFTGGGFRIWVTRQGSLVQENPLRPLSPETVLVFQVSVNGRVASAYGPDAQHLRQAGSPKALEESNPTPIRWAGGLDDLPPEFRVVSESGEVLLGPLAFESCGEAPRPAAQAVARGAPPKQPARAASSGGRSGRTPLAMPKGAIPE